jgi:hypothetical protein
MRLPAGLLLLPLLLTQTTQPRITPDNVDRLTVAWTYDTKESTEPPRAGADRPAFEATPVFADNRLYLSTRGASSSRSTPTTAASSGVPISLFDGAPTTAISRTAALLSPAIACTRPPSTRASPA